MTAPQNKMRIVVFGMTIVTTAVVGYSLYVRYKRATTAVVAPEPLVGYASRFSLTDQNGKNFTSDDLAGKPWVADFIFTRCQGPCPLLTTQMKRLKSELGDKSEVRFVSFTVDPEYDTAPILKAYGDQMGVDWPILTGPKADVYKVIQDSFKLAVAQIDGGTADFIHSLNFVLVDRAGKVVGYFNGTEEADLASLKEKIAALANGPQK